MSPRKARSRSPIAAAARGVVALSAVALAACASSPGAQPGAPAPAPAPTQPSRPEPVVDRGGPIPSTPPAPMPMEPVKFPAFQERTLSNGAKVIVVEAHEQPYVSVNLRVETGSAADPAGRAGVAGMTASLLDKGTTTRSAKQIAEAIDFIGATLGGGAGADWTSLTVGVMPSHLDEALGILGDVVMNPTFPADELETQRKRQLSALQFAQSDPSSLASRYFMKAVYGDNPYGDSPTPESVKAIQRSDLVAFHDRFYHPSNALIVVAGDVKADDIVAELNRVLAGWKAGTAPSVAKPAPPSPTRRRLVFIDKPGSVQAVYRVGQLLPPASSDAWVHLDVMNQVLGGGVSGWLFRELRDKKGYTYGAYSSDIERQGPGYFRVQSDARNEVADSAMKDMLALIQKMHDGMVPDSDLVAAKNFLTGSFPLTIETPEQVAGQVATTLLLGRPAGYLEGYRDRVAATSQADVQRTAQEYLHPDRMVMVVVGDASKVLDELTPFADTVEVLDVQGKPISRANLSESGTPTPVDVDASKIQPATQTYQIGYQGNPIGEAKTVIAREQEAGRPVVHVTTTLSGALSQTQQVYFGATDFRPMRSSASGGPASVELRVEDGRVKGVVSIAGQAPDTLDIAYEPGLLLPGMDQFVLGQSELAPGKDIRMRVVSPQAGGSTMVGVHVVGDTTLTVPAGTFDAWQLDLSGPQPMTIYVRKAAPHVVVKQEFAGQPVVMELKELSEGK